MKWLMLSFLFMPFLFCSQEVFSQQISQKHIVFLQPVADGLMGQHIYSIIVEEKSAKYFAGVLAPDEQRQLTVVQGGTAEELTIKEIDNQVFFGIEGRFDPGQQMIITQFIAESQLGTASLSFNLPYDVDELLFLTPKDGFELKINGFNRLEKHVLGHREFTAYQGLDLKQGRQIKVEVRGLPLTRAPFSWLAWFLAILLVSGLVVVVLKGKKQLRVN